MVNFSPTMNYLQVLPLGHPAMAFEHCSLEVYLFAKCTKAYQHDSACMLPCCSLCIIVHLSSAVCTVSCAAVLWDGMCFKSAPLPQCHPQLLQVEMAMNWNWQQQTSVYCCNQFVVIFVDDCIIGVNEHAGINLVMTAGQQCWTVSIRLIHQYIFNNNDLYRLISFNNHNLSTE